MQLFVRASRTHVVHIAQESTVLHLKRAVQQREGTPLARETSYPAHSSHATSATRDDA